MAAGVEQEYARGVVGEFGDALPAAAAGRAGIQIVEAAGDREGVDSPAAGDRHGGDGAGFGAGTQRIGPVLDIAADVNAIVLVEQRAADTIPRIPAAGMSPRAFCGFDELGVADGHGACGRLAGAARGANAARGIVMTT